MLNNGCLSDWRTDRPPLVFQSPAPHHGFGTTGRFLKSFGCVVKRLGDIHVPLSFSGCPSWSGVDFLKRRGARVECHASVLTRVQRSVCRVQDRDQPLKSKSSLAKPSLSLFHSLPSRGPEDKTDNGLKGLLNARSVGWLVG